MIICLKKKERKVNTTHIWSQCLPHTQGFPESVHLEYVERHVCSQSCPQNQHGTLQTAWRKWCLLKPQDPLGLFGTPPTQQKHYSVIC